MHSTAAERAATLQYMNLAAYIVMIVANIVVTKDGSRWLISSCQNLAICEGFINMNTCGSVAHYNVRHKVTGEYADYSKIYSDYLNGVDTSLTFGVVQGTDNATEDQRMWVFGGRMKRSNGWDGTGQEDQQNHSRSPPPPPHTHTYTHARTHVASRHT